MTPQMLKYILRIPVKQIRFFLIKNPGEKYKVLSTGERGSGITMEFEELGCALNYMLCLLRFKKDMKDKF